jgi:hypothetical protein
MLKSSFRHFTKIGVFSVLSSKVDMGLTWKCSQCLLFLVAIVPSQAVAIVVICRNSHSG